MDLTNLDAAQGALNDAAGNGAVQPAVYGAITELCGVVRDLVDAAAPIEPAPSGGE